MSQAATTRMTPRNFKRELTIRWFTPRGRAAIRELLDDLRHGEGSHVWEILREMRRPGLPEQVLDLRFVDLRGEDLAGSSLVGVDLSGALLDGSNLMQADLTKAVLTHASLVGSDLAGATLEEATLHNVDLSRADLSEANLKNADLRGSLLSGTKLRRTFVRGVDFKFARLEGVDLSQVRRDSYQARRKTRRNATVGAPPMSEPRTPAERRHALRSNTQRFPARQAPSPTTRLLGPFLPGKPGIEEALARLLLSKDRVGRLTATIDGEEIVLFEASPQLLPSTIRRAA